MKKRFSDEQIISILREAEAGVSARITELALERRRFGYRRIWQLLRREGLHVNHKRYTASIISTA